jgi:recombination protein RecA
MICICGTEFSPKRSTAKYCSNKCKVKDFRDKDLLDPDTKDIKEVVSRARNTMDKMNKALAARGLPLMVMGSDIPPVEFISSGIGEVDEITKGFPRKKITEIYGLKGVGKTYLMSHIVSSLPELKICYIDAEGGLPTPPDNVEVNNEHQLEAVADIVEEALKNDIYDLIVVDSIASLIPRAEIEGDSGDVHMGLKARLMSQWMRRISTYLFKSNTAVVFINQQRESMNPYGPNKFTPGGYAVPYAASLRLELKSNKVDKFEGGHWVNVEVEKSRVCKPYQKARFKLIYG